MGIYLIPSHSYFLDVKKQKMLPEIVTVYELTQLPTFVIKT